MNDTRSSTPTAARLARRSLFLLALSAGCTSSDGLGERDERPRAIAATGPAPSASAELLTFQTFAVNGTPPAGWTFKTNSINDRSEHVTWVSPSGATAYGAIFFKLPFPVGHELAFTRGFLAEMRKREGEPEVLDKRWDDEIGGIRFTVRSPRYTVEAKFFVKGLRGYAVYAGTRTDLPTSDPELAEARAARESTRFAREINAKERRRHGDTEEEKK